MQAGHKVCVFGGNGFIGQSVVRALVRQGYSVTVCDKTITSRLTGADDYLLCDLFDFERLREVTKGVDYVFNFAGISDLDKCIDSPFESANVNIIGNINLLLAASQNHVKRFVYASSLYALGDSGGFYGCSKRASELYVEEFNKQMQLPYTIINYGSVFGVGSGPENPIYRLITDALSLGRVQYTGDELSSREYIDVYDAARGTVAALGNSYVNKRVLITGEQSITKKDFSRLVAEVLSVQFDSNESPVIEHKHYSKTPVRVDIDIPIKLRMENASDLALSIRKTIEYIMKERTEVPPQ